MRTSTPAFSRSMSASQTASVSSSRSQMKYCMCTNFSALRMSAMSSGKYVEPCGQTSTDTTGSNAVSFI